MAEIKSNSDLAKKWGDWVAGQDQTDYTDACENRPLQGEQHGRTGESRKSGMKTLEGDSHDFE